MARKIPTKKHRGFKDVEKQRVKRLTELELRTNSPPKDPDEQTIPKSLERVIQLKEAAKNSSGIVKRKRRKKNALICVGQERSRPHPKGRPDKVVPIFQQRPGESAERFLSRVSRDTDAFIKECEFEKKYNVQVNRDPVTRRIQGLTKCKPEKDDAEALKIKHKNIKKQKKVETKDTLTKSQKRKLKLRLRKERKLEADDDDGFERFEDKIAFGEVAHEPPRLSRIKMKKANEEKKPKELLLNSLLQNNTEKIPAVGTIDRSAKRKNLPIVERIKLEKQQSEAIAAYRQLKSQRSIEIV